MQSSVQREISCGLMRKVVKQSVLVGFRFQSTDCLSKEPGGEVMRVGKLMLEFDKTSQRQRVRFRDFSTEAIFSVLATWIEQKET